MLRDLHPSRCMALCPMKVKASTQHGRRMPTAWPNHPSRVAVNAQVFSTMLMTTVVNAVPTATATANRSCFIAGSFHLNEFPFASFLQYGLCGRHLECGIEGVPRQRGALDAARIISHASQRRQVVKVVFDNRFCRHQGQELLNNPQCLKNRSALHHQRHQRSRRHEDGATSPLEADVLDDVVADVEVDGAAVAAERVVSFGLGGCSPQFAVVAGPGGVVEQDVLVQVVYTPHMPSHSLVNWFSKGRDSPLPKSISSSGRRER